MRLKRKENFNMTGEDIGLEKARETFYYKYVQAVEGKSKAQASSLNSNGSLFLTLLIKSL